MKRTGRKSAAQTPAPKKYRIKVSVKNKKGCELIYKYVGEPVDIMPDKFTPKKHAIKYI